MLSNTYGPRLKDCRGDGLEVIETFRGDDKVSLRVRGFAYVAIPSFLLYLICFLVFAKDSKERSPRRWGVFPQRNWV